MALTTRTRKSENSKKYRNSYRVFDRVAADGAAAHQTGRTAALSHRRGQPCVKQTYNKVIEIDREWGNRGQEGDDLWKLAKALHDAGDHAKPKGKPRPPANSDKEYAQCRTPRIYLKPIRKLDVVGCLAWAVADAQQTAVAAAVVLSKARTTSICAGMRLRMRFPLLARLFRVIFPAYKPHSAGRYGSTSITMLSRVVTNPLELRPAEGIESAPSHQPGLDRAENLFPRRTKSFFCGVSRRSG